METRSSVLQLFGTGLAEAIGRSADDESHSPPNATSGTIMKLVKFHYVHR